MVQSVKNFSDFEAILKAGKLYRLLCLACYLLQQVAGDEKIEIFHTKLVWWGVLVLVVVCEKNTFDQESSTSLAKKEKKLWRLIVHNNNNSKILRNFSNICSTRTLKYEWMDILVPYIPYPIVYSNCQIE